MKRAFGTALLAGALTLGLVTSGMAAPRHKDDSTSTTSGQSMKDSKHKKSHKKHQSPQAPAAPQS